MLRVHLRDEIAGVFQDRGDRHRSADPLGVEGDLRTVGQERPLVPGRPEIDVLLAGTGQSLHGDQGIDRDIPFGFDLGLGLDSGAVVDEFEAAHLADPVAPQRDIVTFLQAAGAVQVHSDGIGAAQRVHPHDVDHQIGSADEQRQEDTEVRPQDFVLQHHWPPTRCWTTWRIWIRLPAKSCRSRTS